MWCIIMLRALATGVYFTASTRLENDAVTPASPGAVGLQITKLHGGKLRFGN